jgi:hypothetical protein
VPISLYAHKFIFYLNKMFFSIVKWVLISLTLIFLVHHLSMFLMNTLTVPKIKDLVTKPTQQYEEIYATINRTTPSYSNTSASSTSSTDNVADELSSFLTNLKKAPSTSVSSTSVSSTSVSSTSVSTTDINSLPSSDNMGYSLY